VLADAPDTDSVFIIEEGTECAPDLLHFLIAAAGAIRADGSLWAASGYSPHGDAWLAAGGSTDTSLLSRTESFAAVAWGSTRERWQELLKEMPADTLPWGWASWMQEAKQGHQSVLRPALTRAHAPWGWPVVLKGMATAVVDFTRAAPIQGDYDQGFYQRLQGATQVYSVQQADLRLHCRVPGRVQGAATECKLARWRSLGVLQGRRCCPNAARVVLSPPCWG